MKTRIISRRNTCYELIVSNGDTLDNKQVLASMVLFESTGCWMLTDIRLHQHKEPSAYSGSLSNSDISCQYKPDDESEAEFVKGLLREYTINTDGSISWSSFEGLVRGDKRPCCWSSNFHNGIGYFSRAEGYAYLKKLQEFWAGCEEDPSKVKIPNPHRQPTDSVVRFMLFEKKFLEHKLSGEHRSTDLQVI